MFLNGFFWAVFGFAVVDWFIAIPNSLGALLAAVQIVLCVVYPRVAKGTTCVDTDIGASANGVIVDEAIEVGFVKHEMDPEQASGLASALPITEIAADKLDTDS